MASETIAGSEQERLCAYCGKEFTAKKKGSKYCTRKCKDAEKYAANREKLCAKQKAYRAANLKQERVRSAAYHAAHRKETLARHAKWYAANPEKVRAKNAAYYAAHQQILRAKKAAYKAAHPEKNSHYYARWRTRKRGASDVSLTTAQWKAIKEHFDFRCVYCLLSCKACKQKTHRLTQDHITPVSRQGNHNVWNVVPACRSCNSKKHTGPPLKPVQPLLLCPDGAQPKVVKQRTPKNTSSEENSKGKEEGAPEEAPEEAGYSNSSAHV